MSQRRTKQISRGAASATAISAIGLLTVPVPAHAIPAIPLAPQCTEFAFNGPTKIHTATGWELSFNSTGSEAHGDVVASLEKNGEGNPASNFGTVVGLIQGNTISLHVTWNTRTGDYTGQIDPSGLASGDSVDTKLGNEAGTAWNLTEPLRCVSPAAPVEPAPPVQQERADTDGDGLFDDDEKNVYHTNPSKPDSDGDFRDDGQEVFEHTNPLIPVL